MDQPFYNFIRLNITIIVIDTFVFNFFTSKLGASKDSPKFTTNRSFSLYEPLNITLLKELYLYLLLANFFNFQFSFDFHIILRYRHHT